MKENRKDLGTWHLTQVKVGESQIEKRICLNFFVKNQLLVDPCPQNSTTEVTLYYLSIAFVFC